MAKKRRTKVQKERAASRRQHGVEIIKEASKPIVTSKLPKASKAKTPSATESKTLATGRVVRSNDLRFSLAIFAGLILAQILIGLLFNFTELDSQLYRLISL